jgi:hypothetical protein
MERTYFIPCLCLVLVLVSAGIFSGCISPAQNAPQKPLLTVTSENPATQEIPVTREITRTQVPVTSSTGAAFGSLTDMTTAKLSHGVTISYPVNWRKEETGSDTQELRDYGRYTINIANFYSPDITSDRLYAAGANPDKSKYTSLSIDVDPDATSDFERYFNLATLAVGREYSNIEITKRNVQLKISITDTFPGYKSYELDFDTDTMRGKYIFTNVDGTIYVFAFRNPSPYSKEIENIYKSIIISPGA